MRRKPTAYAVSAVKEYNRILGQAASLSFMDEIINMPVSGLHRKEFTKNHYKTFLRLNDRKRMQTSRDLKNAGYPYTILTDFPKFIDCTVWCNEQYGKYGYANFMTIFFFENKEDHLMFELRWK